MTKISSKLASQRNAGYLMPPKCLASIFFKDGGPARATDAVKSWKRPFSHFSIIFVSAPLNNFNRHLPALELFKLELNWNIPDIGWDR